MAKKKRIACPYRERTREEMQRLVAEDFLILQKSLRTLCEDRRIQKIFPYDDGTGHIVLCALSYSMLAARAGVSVHAVRAWLTGWSYLNSFHTAWAICTALGVVIDKVKVRPWKDITIYAATDYQLARLSRLDMAKPTKHKVGKREVVPHLAT